MFPSPDVWLPNQATVIFLSQRSPKRPRQFRSEPHNTGHGDSPLCSSAVGNSSILSPGLSATLGSAVIFPCSSDNPRISKPSIPTGCGAPDSLVSTFAPASTMSRVGFGATHNCGQHSQGTFKRRADAFDLPIT